MMVSNVVVGQGQLRQSMVRLSDVLKQLGEVTNEGPSSVPFLLYSRSTFDGPLLERAYDRTEGVVRWLERWRMWSSLTLDPVRLEEIRHRVELAQETAVRARGLIVEAISTYRESATAEAMLLYLRVGLSALVDGRERVLKEDRRVLREELQRLLAETEWGDVPAVR